MELSIHSATVRDLTFVNTAAGGNPVLASGGAGKLTIIIDTFARRSQKMETY